MFLSCYKNYTSGRIISLICVMDRPDLYHEVVPLICVITDQIRALCERKKEELAYPIPGMNQLTQVIKDFFVLRQIPLNIRSLTVLDLSHLSSKVAVIPCAAHSDKQIWQIFYGRTRNISADFFQANRCFCLKMEGVSFSV